MWEMDDRPPQVHRVLSRKSKEALILWGGGELQPWVRVWLGEWSLGGILVPIYLCPTHLETQGSLLLCGCGGGELGAEGTRDWSCMSSCYLALEV